MGGVEEPSVRVPPVVVDLGGPIQKKEKGEWGRVGGELTPDCGSGGEVRSGGPTHFLFTIVELRVEPRVGRAELRADTTGKRIEIMLGWHSGGLQGA